MVSWFVLVDNDLFCCCVYYYHHHHHHHHHHYYYYYYFIYIYLFYVIFFQDQLDELVNKVEDKLKNLDPWSQGQVLSSVVEERIGRRRIGYQILLFLLRVAQTNPRDYFCLPCCVCLPVPHMDSLSLRRYLRTRKLLSPLFWWRLREKWKVLWNCCQSREDTRVPFFPAHRPSFRPLFFLFVRERGLYDFVLSLEMLPKKDSNRKVNLKKRSSRFPFSSLHKLYSLAWEKVSK